MALAGRASRHAGLDGRDVVRSFAPTLPAETGLRALLPRCHGTAWSSSPEPEAADAGVSGNEVIRQRAYEKRAYTHAVLTDTSRTPSTTGLRSGVQHHPVEGMGWLVSGLLQWCCMSSTLSPLPLCGHGLKADPPVMRYQILVKPPSLQVLRSWRATLLLAVPENVFTKYLYPARSQVQRGARVACIVLGGLQPFRVRLTVEPVWPAVNGVPARSNGRLSTTLLA